MKISIRWALISGLLLMIWATQISTISTAYLSSQKVLMAHARDIMENIADLAMEQSQKHLANAQGAAHLTRRLLSANVVGKKNPDQYVDLERYFFDQLNVNPQFAGIYFGEPNGDFFDVRRDNSKVDGGFRTKITVQSASGKQTRLIWRNAEHQRIASTQIQDDPYDPRDRPWYIGAVDEERIVWTDPYIFFTSRKPGITIAGPTFSPDQRLNGVVGVDIEIDQLSTFIGKMRIGKSGRAFILNRNGDVIAFPDIDMLRFSGETNGKPDRLVKISELDDPLARKAFGSVNWQVDAKGRIVIKAAQFAEFEDDGRLYHAMFTPFPDNLWPWVIGVYLPEDDYIGPIKDNRFHNILVTLFASLAATLFGLWLARGIIRPMGNLEREVQAVKKKDFESRFNTLTIYREIHETAESFGQMKAALRESREKYKGIFANIQDIYYETSIDGTILEISPSIERYTGYSRTDLLNRSVLELYKIPEDREPLMQRFLENGKVSDYEVVMSDRSDNDVWCSINAVLVRGADGRPQKITGSLRVINDRKKAEDKLAEYRERLEQLVKERTVNLLETNRQLLKEIEQRKQTETALSGSEEKYRTILEDIEEGYFETDLDGCFTFFNDSLCRIMGGDCSALIGTEFSVNASPDSAKRLRAFLGRIRRDREPVKMADYEITRDDGTHRILALSASMLQNDSGLPLGYRGLVHDVTEMVEAERERRRLEDRFQQAQRLKGLGTLAGGVAHDFNNLLMGIQGNVSVMLLDLEPGSDLLENVRSIQECVESGAKLTRQLLGFARGGKYLAEPTDPNTLVRATSQMFGRTRKEITIHEDFAERIWPVVMDQKQIEQVLLNIYINAWQAMPNGGDLFLKIENVMLGPEDLTPHDIRPGRFVKISIRDTGIGMDETTRQRIFEPFFTTKEIGTGTGLGLASVFGIIKNHSGLIDVTSAPGKGATFSISLPASDRPVEGPKDAGSVIQTGTETLLLVDDEPAILKTCKIMLERVGYTVLSAGDGKSALRIFTEHRGRVELVILDIIMPGMNGGEVFDRLKAIDPNVKVLLCSGYSIEGQATTILRRGGNGFLQKPFESEQLYSKIREILK